MTIKAWFPTFIYHEKLHKKPLGAFNRKLTEDCYRIKTADKRGQVWSKNNYYGGYTSYASMSELNKLSSLFMELEKLIDRHVIKFSKKLEFDLGSGKLKMTSCWVNIMPAGTTHSNHIHPLSVISGTYYVKTPRNCGAIKFEDPRLDRFMAAPPRKSPCSEKNLQTVRYKPRAGDLILFESWLRHEVEPGSAPQDRISISFNYDWC
ncbi:MAG: hypothetical protein D6719_11490 [Candidatus Dadabacteria bacterium]|nr:MAG: hypothetical protein D6719_11490 [Candidatus Dadabacteria bacterium]